MSKRYTAKDMREMALVEESYGWDVVAEMLRQAAYLMERMRSVVSSCDDIISQAEKCKTCKVCENGPRKLFRGGYCWNDYSFKGCDNYIGEYAMAQIDLAKRIRREVGEWEEVPSDGE